jgi:regulator of replication initiation timing
MEVFSVLEKKMEALVELVRELKRDKARLIEENTQLLMKLEMLESSLLADNDRLEKFNQERVITKTVVDDLIRSIDLLVEDEKQR